MIYWILLVLFLSRRSLSSGSGAIWHIFHKQVLSRDVGHIMVFGLNMLESIERIFHILWNRYFNMFIVVIPIYFQSEVITTIPMFWNCIVLFWGILEDGLHHFWWNVLLRNHPHKFKNLFFWFYGPIVQVWKVGGNIHVVPCEK